MGRSRFVIVVAIFMELLRVLTVEFKNLDGFTLGSSYFVTYYPKSPSPVGSCCKA